MVLRRDDMRALCLSVLEEAAAVGRAEGARLAPDAPQRTLAALFSVTDDLGTSMYFDTLAGRRLEVEALTGAIVAAGERHGIATPLNRALLALLRAISDGAAAGGRRASMMSSGIWPSRAADFLTIGDCGTIQQPQGGNRLPRRSRTSPKRAPDGTQRIFPTRTIGNDPAKIRDWAQAAEDLGYDHIEVPDHIFGATARGDWQPIYTEKDAFQETFTTLAFLAALTRKARLASGVLILPQRQTGLVAKQAAEVDVLSGGRLRLGIGVG